MERRMKHNECQDIPDSLQLLTDTAERFLHHGPRSKGVEQLERAMLAAITKAQLTLSLHRLPPPPSESSRRATEKTPPKPGQRKSARALMRLV